MWPGSGHFLDHPHRESASHLGGCVTPNDVIISSTNPFMSIRKNGGNFKGRLARFNCGRFVRKTARDKNDGG
jgi:hypothetical protein